ncbi:MAG: LolA family protein [Desulfonatronovibrionaceae bacterium]
MKRLILVFLLLFPAAATGFPEEEILDSLQREAREIKTISSRFVQKKDLSMFENTLRSKGRFYFRDPDCLRWEYTAPYEQGFALCKKKGVKWDEISGEQKISTTGNPMWEILSEQLIAWSRLDMARLQKNYRIQVKKKDPLVLTLVPKAETMRNAISELVIRMSRQKGVIQEITFFEPDGDRTRIEFNSTQTNTSLPQGIFSGK